MRRSAVKIFSDRPGRLLPCGVPEPGDGRGSETSLKISIATDGRVDVSCGSPRTKALEMHNVIGLLPTGIWHPLPLSRRGHGELQGG
jgi:hypothetical protein